MRDFWPHIRDRAQEKGNALRQKKKPERGWAATFQKEGLMKAQPPDLRIQKLLDRVSSRRRPTSGLTSRICSDGDGGDGH